MNDEFAKYFDNDLSKLKDEIAGRAVLERQRRYKKLPR
jgi:hypothetical protein